MYSLFKTKSRKTNSQKRLRKLSLESLESRKLMSVTPLPMLPGSTSSSASAINDSGQVVGYSYGTSSSGVAYDAACAWTQSSGAWTVAALPNPFGSYNSVANAINASGEVVGYCNNGSVNVPFVWTPNGSGGWTATALSLLQAGEGGQARAVNASGDVVGQAHYETSTGTTVLYACLWTPNTSGGWTLTNLGTLSGPNGFYAEAADGINASGQVVGYGVDSSGEVGFLYSNGSMTDLGNYSATAINDSGVVVGSNPSGAFVYSNGEMTSLGGNGANGINISGQVVGAYGGDPCLWQQVGTTWTVTYIGGSGAYAINDSGEIAGVSSNASGALQATLWTAPFTNTGYTGYSLNWSGYAVNTANDAVTAVGGSWTVPTVTKTGSSTAYASVWVGIDGSTNSTVEQIGTGSIITPSGVVTNDAWYEMYPSGGVVITMATSTSTTHGRSNSVSATVKPGDSITASVTYIGSSDFTLTITDTTEEMDLLDHAKT